MDAEDRLARVAVFVGVVLIVALVVGLVAALASSGPTDTPVAYPNSSEMIPERVEATDPTGDDSPVGDEPRVVLVDDSHGNRFDPGDLQPLRDALGPRHEVVFTTGSQSALRADLSRADAYVVIDPSFSHSEEQVAAVESFVGDGGRVVLLGEPTRVGVTRGPLGGSLRDIRSELGGLSGRFGVAFGTDYLYDEVNNEGNYKRILADGRGELDGDRAALYTATTVRASGGERLLVTPETARLSTRSDARSHTVAVRSGNVVAVGDSTFLAGEKAVVADNERLVRTIAAFAVGGDRTRGVADYPHFLSGDLRVEYTSGELLNATKALVREVRGTGRSVSVSASAGSVSTERTDVLVTTFEDLERSNAPGMGIEVTATSVSVPGYEGPRDRVTVVHRPEGEIDLVVAASSPEHATATVRALNDGRLREDALSNRTIVVVGSTEDEEPGIGEPPGADEPIATPTPGPPETPETPGPTETPEPTETTETPGPPGTSG